jgi:hypothetical protein
VERSDTRGYRLTKIRTLAGPGRGPGRGKPAGVRILAGAQFTRGGSLRSLTAGLPSLHASGVRSDAYVDDTTTSQSKRKIRDVSPDSPANHSRKMSKLQCTPKGC